MRVIAGSARGVPLKGPPRAATRATSDKVRGAIFDALVLYLDDARVLDLYAGTGALGIEALSRGAASCLFVERAAPVCRVVEANLRTARLAEGGRVWRAPVETALDRLEATLAPAHVHVPTHDGPAIVVAGQRTDTVAPAEAAITDTGDDRATRPRSRAHHDRGQGAFLPPGFGPPYDIILLDPPYDDPGIAGVIERVSLAGFVAPGGFIVLEHGKRVRPPHAPVDVRPFRARLYGDTAVTIWRRDDGEAEV